VLHLDHDIDTDVSLETERRHGAMVTTTTSAEVEQQVWRFSNDPIRPFIRFVPDLYGCIWTGFSIPCLLSFDCLLVERIGSKVREMQAMDHSGHQPWF
jgi:hypothetical protein